MKPKLILPLFLAALTAFAEDPPSSQDHAQIFHGTTDTTKLTVVGPNPMTNNIAEFYTGSKLRFAVPSSGVIPISMGGTGTNNLGGTNNALPLRISPRNIYIGYSAPNITNIGIGNTVVGNDSFTNASNCNFDTVSGEGAMALSIIGDNNDVSGWHAMWQGTGGYNTIHGSHAFNQMTLGILNTGSGGNVGGGVVQGSYLTLSGAGCLTLGDPSYSVISGEGTLNASVATGVNDVDGAEAMPTSGTSSNNVSKGFRNLYNLFKGDGNAVLGNTVATNLSFGGSNVFLMGGPGSLPYLTNGHFNVVLDAHGATNLAGNFTNILMSGVPPSAILPTGNNWAAYSGFLWGNTVSGDTTLSTVTNGNVNLWPTNGSVLVTGGLKVTGANGALKGVVLDSNAGAGVGILANSVTNGILSLYGGTTAANGAGLFMTGTNYAGAPTLSTGGITFAPGLSTSTFQIEFGGTQWFQVVNTNALVTGGLTAASVTATNGFTAGSQAGITVNQKVLVPGNTTNLFVFVGGILVSNLANQ